MAYLYILELLVVMSNSSKLFLHTIKHATLDRLNQQHPGLICFVELFKMNDEIAAKIGCFK